nr:MAG: hypothetical protein 1 [Tombusviridae sp.]
MPKERPVAQDSKGEKVIKSQKMTVGAVQNCKVLVTPTGDPKPDPPKKVLRKFARPWVISEKGLSLLASNFPMFEIAIDTSQALQPHEHPYSAFERAMTEELAYQQVRSFTKNGLVVDIGGNARRHLCEGRSQIHSCCPVIEPADVLRNSRYGARHDFCTNKVQDCDRVPAAYMAIHSLYYLKPADVLGLVYKSSCKVMVATAHRFVQGYGKFHFNGVNHESRYELVSPDCVKMVVTGNDHGAYEHDPLFWLERSHFELNGQAITWGSRKYGDTLIYTIVPCPTGMGKGNRSQDLAAFESMKRSDHYGEVALDTGSNLPTMELLNLTQVKVRSLGPLFWTTKTKRQMFIPKGMVSSIAYKMAGKPRTRDTWQICMRESKKVLDKEILDIPESWRVQLAIHLPAIAFVVHLEDEISAFNSLITPKATRLYEQLSRALSLAPDARSCWTPLARALPWNCCRSRYARNQTEYEAGQVVVDTYNDDRSSAPVLSALPSPGTVFEFMSTTSTVALKQMRKGSFVVKKAVEDVMDKKSLYQHTTTFAGHIPIVSTSNQENEYVALRNRVCMDVYEPKEGVWDALLETTLLNNWIDFDEIRHCIDFDVDRAFEKWNASFPPGRRRNQSAAWAKLQSQPLERENFIRKTFVKVEKLLKSTADGYDGHTPRAIQGDTDEANVTLGPFVQQYAKALAKQWNGDGIFFYTSGATGDQVGQWMADNYEPGDLIIEVDMSLYDGTQRKGPYEMTGSAFTAAGMDDFGDAAIVYDNHRNIVGYTRHGVKYKADYGMCSGNTETSVGNSQNTGLTAADILTKTFGPGFGKIAVHGDDNTSIIKARSVTRAGLTHAEIKSAVEKGLVDFGFVPKVKVLTELAKAEFCSGVFWPAVVDGVETYVLGAKPGKQLPKIGYATTKHKPEVVKAMMLGNRHAYHFVPLLDIYCETVLSKMEGVEAGSYVDKEAQYKIQSVGKQVTKSAMLGCFFEERYGLDYDVVQESLRTVLACSELDSSVHWEFMAPIYEVDV